LRVAVELREKVLGPVSPASLESVRELALTLKDQGSLIEPKELLSNACKSCRESLGPDHEQTLRCESRLADVLVAGGETKEAEPLVRRTLLTRLQLLAEDLPP